MLPEIGLAPKWQFIKGMPPAIGLALIWQYEKNMLPAIGLAHIWQYVKSMPLCSSRIFDTKLETRGSREKMTRGLVKGRHLAHGFHLFHAHAATAGGPIPSKHCHLC